MPDRKPVRTRRGQPHVEAWCNDCGQRWDERGTADADRARAQAKRHAEQTGHPVCVRRSVVTYLNPKR